MSDELPRFGLECLLVWFSYLLISLGPLRSNDAGAFTLKRIGGLGLLLWCGLSLSEAMIFRGLLAGVGLTSGELTALTLAIIGLGLAGAIVSGRYALDAVICGLLLLIVPAIVVALTTSVWLGCGQAMIALGLGVAGTVFSLSRWGAQPSAVASSLLPGEQVVASLVAAVAGVTLVNVCGSSIAATMDTSSELIMKAGLLLIAISLWQVLCAGKLLSSLIGCVVAWQGTMFCLFSMPIVLTATTQGSLLEAGGVLLAGDVLTAWAVASTWRLANRPSQRSRAVATSFWKDRSMLIEQQHAAQVRQEHQPALPQTS